MQNAMEAGAIQELQSFAQNLSRRFRKARGGEGGSVCSAVLGFHLSPGEYECKLHVGYAIQMQKE